MNPIHIISSTLALGAMMGISGTHFLQVKTMVENGPQALVLPHEQPANLAPANDSNSTLPSSPISLALISSPHGKLKTPAAKPAPRAHRAALEKRESALMEILVSIRNEQKNIRAQLSDTNRNVDELTFQVDSHSTQFRPLQTDPNARPRAMVVPEENYGTGVDYGYGMGPGQILPPKQ